MAPLRLLALAGALGGYAAVSAAPARRVQGLSPRLEVTYNLQEPTTPVDPPAGEHWTACDFNDPDCQCTTVGTSITHYCGWVDPTWNYVPKRNPHGRVLLETNSTATVPDTASQTVEADTADPNSAAEKKLDLGFIADDQFPAGTPQDPASPMGQYDGSEDPTPANTTANTNKGPGKTTEPASANIDPQQQQPAANTDTNADAQLPAANTDTNADPQPADQPASTTTNPKQLGDKREVGDASSEIQLERRQNNEIQFRRRHPIYVALRMLGFSYQKLVAASLRCILTRFPREEQGQFVQGITGQLSEPVTVNDGNGFVHRFQRGATFALRWDVTGYEPAGYQQGDAFRGLHVNLLIDDGVTRQKWGIYQLSTINWPLWPDFVGVYLRVRSHLTALAGYYPAGVGFGANGENSGAQSIARSWDALINGNDEL